VKSFWAEFLGTFTLLFFGIGAELLLPPSIQGLGVPAAFGLSVMMGIIVFGDISGAHFNPAVSFGFLTAGRISKGQFFLASSAQLAGGFLSVFILSFLQDPVLTISTGASIPSSGLLITFLLEFILSFFLMLVILHVATGSKEKGLLAGFAVGGYIFLAALVFGGLTGASMNPVRSLVPSLFQLKALPYIWIYLTSPMLGALSASLFYKKVFSH
jgi:aquaporin NIP